MNKDNEKVIKEYLKNNYVISENKTELYWTLIPLIFSRSFFKRGKEIQLFLKEQMGIEYAEYVFKSRTIVAGKLVKTLNELSLEDSVSLNKKATDALAKIINNRINNNIIINSMENINNKSTTKKKSSFMSWHEYIQDNQ